MRWLLIFDYLVILQALRLKGENVIQLWLK